MTTDKPTVTPLTAEEEARYSADLANIHPDFDCEWSARSRRLLATLDAARTDSLDVAWWGERAIEAARRLFAKYPNTDSDGLMEFRVALREYDRLAALEASK